MKASPRYVATWRTVLLAATGQFLVAAETSAGAIDTLAQVVELLAPPSWAAKGACGDHPDLFPDGRARWSGRSISRTENNAKACSSCSRV